MTKQDLIVEMMREWKRIQHQADYLREQITQAVLESGETVDAGDVVAKFNAGKQYHDYKGTVEANRKARLFLIKNYLKVDYLDPSVYRTVCNALDLEAPVSKVYDPTVTLRNNE